MPFLAPKIPTIRFEIRRPSHRTERGQIKGSTAVSSKCWAGLQTLPMASKSSGGADSPLDRPGPLQDNRGKRAKDESAHGCGFISGSSFSAMKPPEDNERIMIDSMPVMAWRCPTDSLIF
jgi:hypothetical protein